MNGVKPSQFTNATTEAIINRLLQSSKFKVFDGILNVEPYTHQLRLIQLNSGDPNAIEDLTIEKIGFEAGSFNLTSPTADFLSGLTQIIYTAAIQGGHVLIVPGSESIIGVYTYVLDKTVTGGEVVGYVLTDDIAVNIPLKILVRIPGESGSFISARTNVAGTHIIIECDKDVQGDVGDPFNFSVSQGKLFTSARRGNPVNPGETIKQVILEVDTPFSNLDVITISYDRTIVGPTQAGVLTKNCGYFNTMVDLPVINNT